MTPEQIKGLLLLVMGLGVLLVALQGLLRGWLPNGPNGYRQGQGVSRAENPFGFWIFFLLYGVGGGYVALQAARLLVGTAG
ncbi:MAG: uncharacterized protein K0R03_1686 [Moraxellaceae bacterium]|jgi:hypothetical protein|nr:uncharacterized protein [Moraxellaceae bacterium]